MVYIYYIPEYKIETVEDRQNYINLYKKIFKAKDEELNEEELNMKKLIIEHRLKTKRESKMKWYAKVKGEKWNEMCRKYYHKKMLKPIQKISENN